MSALVMARWQFALTAGLHFVFVALTLGLAPLIAVMQTRHVVTGRETHARATRFWGRLYLVNYGLGIVSGLVMEFQFGLNWNGLGAFAGAVFGAPMAMETLTAFFLESTFLGLWIFGWGRMPRSVHLALIWLVTVTAYLSAYWVMVANGFLQHPVGATVVAGTVRPTDLTALLSNPEAVGGLEHLLAAALLTGGVFVAGISAGHLARATAETELFRRSLWLGLGVAAPAAALTINRGFAQFDYLLVDQPGKAAAALGAGDPAAVQARLAARFGPGDYLPPHWLSVPAEVMQYAGFALGVLAVLALALLVGSRGRAAGWRPVMRPLSWLVPVPFVAVLLGWLVREEGRQPWLVYGQLLTARAVSPVSGTSVAFSFTVFVGLVAALTVVNWWLLLRLARRGPETPGPPPGAAPSTPDHDTLAAL